ncbi:MAG: carboxylate-amine ligase [Magnetovibrio sp.]|nr:carboxylate-amine ligase [Magnetovibrio sp.]
MVYAPPPFTVGIEEEYLLVDVESRGLAKDPPAELFEACTAAMGDMVAHEFLRSQIEINTPPSASITEVRPHLAEFRKCVAEVAGRFDLAPIAASTHPFSRWSEQDHTDAERYNIIAEDLQAVVRRLVICGMHVHVGIGDDDLRIDLMNQVVYFLPHLLALSTSSPFWQGRDTGLKSYRMSVWDEMPRTGLPHAFDSFTEFQRHVNVMVQAGLIEDGTKIWWDVRPSARYPTLEMRICDVCTRIDDALAVAALFQCTLRMLYRLRQGNQRWRQYSAMLVNENRWRAQRYGIDDGLVDFGRGEIVPYGDLLEEIIELVTEDAEALGCMPEIEHLRVIRENGTSAHRQVARYQAALAEGLDEREALQAVVDLLIADTKDAGRGSALPLEP